MYLLSKDPGKFLKKVLEFYKKEYHIERLYEACEKVFPGRWSIGTEEYHKDIKLDSINYHSSIKNFIQENYIHTSVHIHFPEFIIKGNNIQHTITDLYVKIQIIFNCYAPYINLKGVRSSRTVEELQVGYVHSHLNSSEYNTFNNFCLGDGPLAYYANYNLKKDKSVDEWQYYLNLLNNYVQWESASGVPYIFMNRIGSSNIEDSCPTYISNNILRNNTFKNIKYKIKSNKIEVIPTEELESEVYNYMKDSSYKNYTCFKDSEGNYTKKEHVEIADWMTNLEGKELLIFNDKPITFKISNKKNIQNYENNVPNPSITKGICNILSKELTKIQVKRNSTRQKDKINNTQESISSNTMVM